MKGWSGQGPAFFYIRRMKNKRLLLPLLLTALLLVAGCKSKQLPEGVLDHDQMVAFLYDAYLLEGCYSVETNYAYDSLSPEIAAGYDAIMERQKITREQVEASMDYYAQNLLLYNAINKEVLALLEKETATDTVATKSVAIEVVPIM